MLIVCPSCASEYTIEAGRLGPQGRRVRCAACRESWHVEAPAEEALAAAPASAELAAMVEAPQTLRDVEPEPVATSEPSPLAASDMAIPAAEVTDDPAPAEPVSADLSPTNPGSPDIFAAEPPAEPVTIESRDHASAPSGPKAQLGKAPKSRKAGKAATAKAKRAPAAVSPRRAGLASLGAALAAGLACAAVLAGRNAVVSVVPEAAVVFERLGLPVNVVGLTFAEVASSMTPSVPGGGAPGVLVVEGRIDNPTRREIDVPDIDIAVRGEGGELLYNWSVPAAAAKLAGGDGTTFRARLSSPPPAGQRVQVTFRVEGRDVKVALR